MPALNAATLELVKQFEGFVDHWYPDPASGGKPYTCCYGHTDAAGPPFYAKTKSATFTKAEGEAILKRDLSKVADAVAAAITVQVTANQFGACVSLAFNIGTGAFLRSTLRKKLNQADYSGAAEEFSRWNKAAGKVMAGLSRRRAAEKKLFLTEDGPAAVPVPETQSSPATIGWLAALLQFLSFILKGFKP